MEGGTARWICLQAFDRGILRSNHKEADVTIEERRCTSLLVETQGTFMFREIGLANTSIQHSHTICLHRC